MMPDIAELDDRIVKCNKILDESPNSQIFAALAEAYRKKGELEKAFRVCQNGLKIHPNYGSAHMVMAKINLDKGLYDWAQMEVEKVVDLDGNSHATDLLLSEIFIYKGEFAKATRLLDKLKRVDPKNEHVAKLLDIAKKLPLESQKELEPKSAVKDEKPKDAEPEADGSEKAEAEAEEPTRETSPKIVIDILANIPGVDGVLLVNHEGMVAESNWNCDEEPDLYGALSKEIERIIMESIETTGFGKYENILVEADGLIVKFLPLGRNLLLIKANAQVNLGTLRLKLTSLLETCNVNL
jgi:predicted regulator of Ras-like GTPase activity (Roadblock/LC7/MglB family)